MIGLVAAAGTVFVGARLARALFVRPARPESTPPEPVDPARFDGPEVAGRTLEDWRIDGSLLLSGKALVGLGIGAATGLPAALVAGPVLGVVVGGFVARAVADYRRDGQVGVATVDVASSAGTLAAGHLTALSTFMLAVHATRRIARGNEDRTRRVLGRLLEGLRSTVTRVGADGEAEQIAVEALRIDDVIAVHAGELVPVDGVVIAGLARVDRGALSGESAPGYAGPWDAVHAGELLIEGAVQVRVERAGHETRAAQIEALLDAATGCRRRFRAEADDVVDAGARPTLVAAAIALGAVSADAALAIVFAPLAYAMRYTAPISVLGHMQLAAAEGVLVKDGRALELLGRVDVVVFDKTGTLTDPVPRVVELTPLAGADAAAADEALALAAAAEAHQSHPLARAIREEAARRGLAVPASSDVALERGRGLTAQVGERRVIVGSARLLEAAGVSVPRGPAAQTAVYVAVDGRRRLRIDFEARPRSEAAAVITRLQARGLQVQLLSGDRAGPTEALATALGIERWRAEALPDEKAAHVAELQRRGRRVCFVGDGLNDAVALERADVGVAMGSASALAGDLSSVVLTGDDLNGLDALFTLADGLRGDLDRSTLLTTVPNAVVLGGALFFGLGFNAAWALFQLGLWSSMAVALKPVIAARAADEPDAPAVNAPAGEGSPAAAGA